jgi:Fur family ferric uptake transcriptional regulator
VNTKVNVTFSVARSLEGDLTSDPASGTVRDVGTARKSPRLSEEAWGRALERLRGILKARTLKMSKVRESIARAALEYDGHFSVEQLVHMLHASGVRDAHMATVYRAVPLMIEAGLIQRALISEGDSQFYEAAFEREHHDHLVCTSCGRVVEYQSETLEALQREIAERYGFELSDHVNELRGRCRDCRRKTRQ